ncbi:MAG: hypothetical protein EOO61_02260 [Hymenobacter sp.]|nr:MAG: hypothetical protein EOO61_02260 [Hymenobacter sp.]
MNYILDNCSLVNLFNCGMLEKCIECLAHNFFVTPIVYHKECTTCTFELERLVLEDRIYLLDFIPDIQEFANLGNECGIDDGECEAILACLHHGYALASDDKAARKCATKKIGQTRLIGSIGLIKQLVAIGEIECPQAVDAFNSMSVAGAFLPKGKPPNEYIC